MSTIMFISYLTMFWYLFKYPIRKLTHVWSSIVDVYWPVTNSVCSANSLIRIWSSSIEQNRMNNISQIKHKVNSTHWHSPSSIMLLNEFVRMTWFDTITMLSTDSNVIVESTVSIRYIWIDYFIASIIIDDLQLTSCITWHISSLVIQRLIEKFFIPSRTVVILLISFIIAPER
jgi:hypothetical protein